MAKQTKQAKEQHKLARDIADSIKGADSAKYAGEIGARRTMAEFAAAHDWSDHDLDPAGVAYGIVKEVLAEAGYPSLVSKMANVSRPAARRHFADVEKRAAEIRVEFGGAGVTVFDQLCSSLRKQPDVSVKKHAKALAKAKRAKKKELAERDPHEAWVKAALTKLEKSKALKARYDQALMEAAHKALAKMAKTYHAPEE